YRMRRRRRRAGAEAGWSSAEAAQAPAARAPAVEAPDAETPAAEAPAAETAAAETAAEEVGTAAARTAEAAAGAAQAVQDPSSAQFGRTSGPATSAFSRSAAVARCSPVGRDTSRARIAVDIVILVTGINASVSQPGAASHPEAALFISGAGT